MKTDYVKFRFPPEILNDAIDNLGGPIVITDSAANIIYVNKAFELTTGYSRAEVIGKNPRILQTTGTDKKVYARLWDMLTSGRMWHGEFVNKRKDGLVYSEGAVITPFISENNTYYAGLKFDITAMKNRRQGLEIIIEEAQKVVDALPVFISAVDRKFRYLFVNSIYSESFNIPQKDIIGKPVDQVLPDPLREKHMEYLKTAFEGKEVYFEDQGPSPDSPIKSVYGMYLPYHDSTGAVQAVIDFTFDSTAKTEVELERKRAKEHFDLIAGNIPGLIFQFSLSAAGEWSFGFMEGDYSLLERIGLDVGSIQHDPDFAFKLVEADKRGLLNIKLMESAEKLTSFKWVGEFSNPKGSCWLQLSASPQLCSDSSICWTGLAMDITELKNAEKKIHELNDKLKIQAETDYQTGLLNRRKFVEEVHKELERAVRYGENFCFAILDLDNFKSVNDLFGHAAGDLVLADFAGVLKNSLREIDISARIGGEEFAVILPETNLEQAEAVFERLLDSLKKHLVAVPDIESTISYSCSIGLTEYNPDDNYRTLYHRADEFLYTAKREGRARLISDADMKQEEASV